MVATLRNLQTVIDACLKHIPKDNIATIRLAKLKQDVPYTPPEHRSDNWRAFCEILSEELPNPDSSKCPKWAREVQLIVMDKKDA